MPEPTADEFTCVECGQHVYSLPRRDPPPTLCATCAWLDEFIADPEERERLREELCAFGGGAAIGGIAGHFVH